MSDIPDLDAEYRRIVREHRLSNDHPVSALVCSFIELLGRDRASLPSLKAGIAADIQKTHQDTQRQLNEISLALTRLEYEAMAKTKWPRRLGLIAIASAILAPALLAGLLVLAGQRFISSDGFCFVVEVMTSADGRRGGFCAGR